MSLTPEIKKALQELSKNQFGQAVLKFLDAELKDLKDVTKATSWDDALGRQHAVKIIEKLFNLTEKIEPVSKGKNPYV